MVTASDRAALKRYENRFRLWYAACQLMRVLSALYFSSLERLMVYNLQVTDSRYCSYFAKLAFSIMISFHF